MSPATATSIRKRWPSLRYQMSGRVWMAACGMGSNTRSVTHACTQGPRSGQIACHDLQVELVGCRHELSKHRSDVSDKSVMPGDVVGWVVPVDRARRACRWLDRVICCSAAERAAVRGRRGLEALMNSHVVRCTDRRTPGDTSNCSWLCQRAHNGRGLLADRLDVTACVATVERDMPLRPAQRGSDTVCTNPTRLLH